MRVEHQMSEEALAALQGERRRIMKCSRCETELFTTGPLCESCIKDTLAATEKANAAISAYADELRTERDKERHLNGNLRKAITWMYQFAGARYPRFEVLENLSALSEGDEPPCAWPIVTPTDNDFTGFAQEHHAWALEKFPSQSAESVCRHIEKELIEIRKDENDPMEWIDVIMLAMEGFCMTGGSPHETFEALREKHAINLLRTWQAPNGDDPIEHVR